MNRRFSSASATVGIILLIGSGQLTAEGDEPVVTQALIGYTQFRTNLPEGRHANVRTMRASVVRADGENRRELAVASSRTQDTWTQFAGWSPSGSHAVVGLGWEDPENARWEEENRRFRFTAEGWLYDSLLVDVKNEQAVNLTAVERVSFYNTGLFYWPNDPNSLGFQALIDGESHPFRMNRDGTRKVDLTKDSRGFAYGFGASPDGKRIAYHKDYQIFLADADGSNALHVDTGHPFNFCPKWSPDGRSVLFLAGEHYDCHPHLVGFDGKGLRKIGDRNGYRGVIAFLDVDDFHGGSSDVPVWSAGGESVFYTARVGESIELFRASLDGSRQQLTNSPSGSHNYHPAPSPDAEWIAFGSDRTGTRQLYVMHVPSRRQQAVTDVDEGWGAMWPHWQPIAEGHSN
jgi:Tol biopolymer transport system component